MTTRVIIVADAAQPDRRVHVHEQHRQADGRFERSQTHELSGRGFVEVLVHDGVQLEVHEATVAPDPAAVQRSEGEAA